MLKHFESISFERDNPIGQIIQDILGDKSSKIIHFNNCSSIVNGDNPVVCDNGTATLPSKCVDEMLHDPIRKANFYYTISRY